MAQKLLKPKKAKVAPKKAAEDEQLIVLVGTYKEKQLNWIKENGYYNYPVKDGDEYDEEKFENIKELWLYADVKGTRHCYIAEYAGILTREEFLEQHPTYAKLGKPRHKKYYIFRAKQISKYPFLDNPIVVARASDFGGRSAKVKKAIEQFKADGEFAPLAAYLPADLAQVPRQQLRVCDSGVRLVVWSPVKGMSMQQEKIESVVMSIGAFARHQNMPAAQAYRLLRRNGVLKHLDEHYEIECCLPIEHIVSDMEEMCADSLEVGR